MVRAYVLLYVYDVCYCVNVRVYIYIPPNVRASFKSFSKIILWKGSEQNNKIILDCIQCLWWNDWVIMHRAGVKARKPEGKSS